MNLQSWDEFEDEVEKLKRILDDEEEWGHNQFNFIFRGQADSSWRLDTTLERYTTEKQSLISYYILINNIKSKIETFTNKDWTIPDFSEYEKWLVNYDSRALTNLPAYEYMVYLRHHGFPSPLLDWSVSPYIAAYFAFRELQSKATSVAIFACIEGGAGDFTGGLFIMSLPIYIHSDKRHFLQQCEYTICTSTEERHYYHSHEDVFSRARNTKDFLWKFILPSSERKKALRKLEMYNINAYSLFGSEETLMETVFLRDFYL